MNATIRLGRIAGIPLAAHWSALVVPILVAEILGNSVLPQTAKGAGASAYWTTAVVVALAFMACLVAHELAHAIVARRQGLQVTGITLWMLGGVTAIDGECATPRAETVMAVAGPLTSLGAGLVSGAVVALFIAMGAPDVAIAGAAWLAGTNVLLALFNMLPGAPLDGGRVLHAWAWRRTQDSRRATDIAARGGRGTGLALMAAGVIEVVFTGQLLGGLWLSLIGWFLMSAAVTERTNVEADAALHGLPVGAAMDSRVAVIPSYQTVHAAARNAVAADVDYCPVTDFDGHIVGVVDVNRLVHAAQLPAQQSVADIANALSTQAVTTEETPLLVALTRSRGRLPMLVMRDGQVVGLVTADSLNHAMRRGLVEAGTR